MTEQERTEYWKKHWNTKTSVKEFWHPNPIMETEDQYEIGFEEGKLKGYDEGWDEACEEMENYAWRIKK